MKKACKNITDESIGISCMTHNINLIVQNSLKLWNKPKRYWINFFKLLFILKFISIDDCNEINDNDDEIEDDEIDEDTNKNNNNQDNDSEFDVTSEDDESYAGDSDDNDDDNDDEEDDDQDESDAESGTDTNELLNKISNYYTNN